MRVRALLLVTATVLGLSASGASGATLFTTSAHTTAVTVGATATLTLVPASTLAVTSSGVVWNRCTGGTFDVQVAQNSGGEVRATLAGGSTSGCLLALGFTGPWSLTVAGTGTMSGTSQVFTNANISNVSVDMGGGLYTGSLTTGVSAAQPTATGAPICLNLANAGSLAGPLSGNFRFDGSYCLDGHPSRTWSLT